MFTADSQSCKHHFLHRVINMANETRNPTLLLEEVQYVCLPWPFFMTLKTPPIWWETVLPSFCTRHHDLPDAWLLMASKASFGREAGPSGAHSPGSRPWGALHGATPTSGVSVSVQVQLCGQEGRDCDL